MSCRTDPPNTANGRPCPSVGSCGRICARLPADLAEKLSPGLQMEWAKSQAVLYRDFPDDGDLVPIHRLPPRLYEMFMEAINRIAPVHASKMPSLLTALGQRAVRAGKSIEQLMKEDRAALRKPIWGETDAGCINFE